MSVYTSEDKTLKPELRGDASKGDQTLVEHPEDSRFSSGVICYTEEQV